MFLPKPLGKEGKWLQKWLKTYLCLWNINSIVLLHNFTTFSVGIIIFTIPVKQAKQTQAGFCFIIFQGLMTNCYQDYHISNPLQLCITITQINSKQKTVVKWKTIPQIAFQNLVVSYHSVISTYHIENSCKWPSNIVKWHSKVLETQVIESNHSHKNNGQWKNL